VNFEKNLVMCVVKKKSLKFKKETFMKKIVSIILIILLLGAVASMSSCAKEKNDVNTPETVWIRYSDDAIAQAKGMFESSLSNNSKYSKVYSPSYGKCSAEFVEDEYGNYWKVTLRGSFNYYTDVYASGKLHKENFTESYKIYEYITKGESYRNY